MSLKFKLALASVLGIVVALSLVIISPVLAFLIFWFTFIQVVVAIYVIETRQ